MARQTFGVFVCLICHVVVSINGRRIERATADLSDETIELKLRLDELENDLALVENYVKGEKAIDAILDDLDGPTEQKFLGYMNTVENKTNDMKEEAKNDLKPADERLAAVRNRVNSRNTVIGGVVYFGAIGSACKSWEKVCTTAESECRDNRCQCKPGFSSNVLQQTCVEECPYGYGSTYQTVRNYAIRGFNSKVLENVTLAFCKSQCESATDFVCRSFDWFPAWNTCYLSDVVKGDTEQPEADVDEAINDEIDIGGGGILGWGNEVGGDDGGINLDGVEYDVGDDEDEDKDGWEYNQAAIHFQRDCMVNLNSNP